MIKGAAQLVITELVKKLKVVSNSAGECQGSGPSLEV